MDWMATTNSTVVIAVAVALPVHDSSPVCAVHGLPRV